MKNNLKKMCSYYKNYIGIFLADLFFACLDAAVVLAIPLVVRHITGTVIYLPPEAAVRQTLILGAVMLLLVAVQGGSYYFITFIGHLMGTRMEADMRSEIFAHYQKMSFHFYDNQKVGQLLSRVTSDLFDICELLHHGPENIVISLLKIGGAFVILFSISWQLALAALALLPFMFVVIYYFNGKMGRAFKNNRAKIAELNVQLEENLSGIRVVKSFANEELEKSKFETGNQRFVAARRNSYYYMAWFHSLLNCMITLITIVVLVTGAVMISKGMVAIEDLITFILYISVFTEPVRTLINFTEMFQNGYSGFSRFMEILSINPDIEDSPDAIELTAVKGQVTFHDVSFQYDESGEMVLSHVDLDVKAGEYVALVGSSGVGKSTICSLIPRFYETTAGHITLDGIDIRDITQKSLREHIGMVQQDVYLFMGTVAENIRYGKPGASMEEVIQAAKNANAHDFIMSLPDGYDTDIGQRGVKLSGGQKQRLSIARVFLKNPPILIFDEATSALDNESEKIVQSSLEKLAANRTTFVIAHRLTTIRNAQRILVLTENGIEEDGTHEELLAKGGAYAKLYQTH